VISGVLALFSWNAGNRALTPINGILFINLVPVTTFNSLDPLRLQHE